MRVANAPCSWGVLEYLDDQTSDWRRVLSEMRAAGYVGTELGDLGFLPTEPLALERAVGESGLALVAGFVPIAFAEPSAFAEGRDRALEVAELMASVNSDAMVLLSDHNGLDPDRRARAGRIGRADGLSDQAWDGFATRVGEVAEAIRRNTGLRSSFHHHCGGFVETADEIEALMTRTDPELLGLCLDTGHCQFAGTEPSLLLHRYTERIWHVHLKDCAAATADRARREAWDYFRAVREGIFCALGQGDVDFQSVLGALQASAYDGWLVVEQDVYPKMGCPQTTAEQSRAFLHGLGI